MYSPQFRPITEEEDIEIKEKINGNLILSQDSPAILDVTLGDLHYTAGGDVVQPALKQP